jgi:hypothetical protein
MIARPHCSQALIATPCQCASFLSSCADFCFEERYFTDAELGRLLDHPVDVIGAGQALDDFSGEPGFGRQWLRGAYFSLDLPAVGKQGGVIVDGLTAVEQKKGRAWFQAQHVFQVMTAALVEGDDLPVDKLGVDVHAGHPHRRRLASSGRFRACKGLRP